VGSCGPFQARSQGAGDVLFRTADAGQSSELGKGSVKALTSTGIDPSKEDIQGHLHFHHALHYCN